MVIADDNKSIIKDSSYSKIYVSANQIQKVAVDYLQFDYPFKKETNHGILKIIKNTISNKDFSNKKSSIEIAPIYFANKSKSVESYVFTANADEFEFRDASVFLKKNGTDSTEDFYTVINPLSGKELLKFTNDNYDLIIPNSKERRYIGFLSTKRDLLEKQEDLKNLLGNLSYASNFNNIQTLEIRVKDEKLYKTFSLYTPKIVLSSNNSNNSNIDDGKRIALMNLTEDYHVNDFSGVLVEITFYYGEDAKELNCIIPITNDQLDIKSAFYDRKILDIK